jgi:hypothetical protein
MVQGSYFIEETTTGGQDCSIYEQWDDPMPGTFPVNENKPVFSGAV